MDGNPLLGCLCLFDTANSAQRTGPSGSPATVLILHSNSPSKFILFFLRPLGLIRHLIELDGGLGLRELQNGSGTAQIARDAGSFHSTRMRRLPRSTGHDPSCGFHLRL
jgi:hypothetical protein